MSTATLEAPWATLSIKIDSENPDHHLWNNHGTWWVHYTIHQADYTKRRVRVSLETRNLREARTRRDALLRHLAVEGQKLYEKIIPSHQGLDHKEIQFLFTY